MVKILIIADDFTGALDTGISFSQKGIFTRVVLGSHLEEFTDFGNACVLVVDLETRPMEAEEAYLAVYKITQWAVSRNIPLIYKKTDSALRGNVGAELRAVLEASRETVYFIPAFPKIRRVTVNGIHYIDGIPLKKSAFGKDPFEPVHFSYLPDILGDWAKNKVTCIKCTQKKDSYKDEQEKIVIFDAVSDENIKTRIKELKEEGKLRFLAGCAAFASFLPKALVLQESASETYEKKKGMYVACGSLNLITRKQVIYAMQKGFFRISLTPRQKLDTAYYKTDEGEQFLESLYQQCISHPRIIVDTFDRHEEETLQYARTIGIREEDVRFSIVRCHSILVSYLIERGVDYTIFMTGGDTLTGLMNHKEHPELNPICELSPGVVLSRLKWKKKHLQIVSKSGGFGTPDVMVKVADCLIEET